MNRAAIALAFLLLASPALAAQTPAVEAGQLQEHDRIRVWAPALCKDPFVGTVVKVDANQLVLQGENGRRTLGWRHVDRLERYAGRYRAAPAILGTGVGGVSAWLGYKSYLNSSTKNDEWNGLVALRAVPIGALAGAAIGAAVGYAKWESIQVNFLVGAGAWDGGRIGVHRSF